MSFFRRQALVRQAPVGDAYAFNYPNTQVNPLLSERSSHTLMYASRLYMTQNREVIQWHPTLIYPDRTEAIDSLLSFRGGDPSTGFIYFEVLIGTVKRPPAIVGIGLAPRNYQSGMVGWDDSIGYHADDGKIFPGQSVGTTSSYGTLGQGDRFGLLAHPQSGTIGFTRNGQFVARVTYDPSKSYLPTVTFDTRCYPEFQIIKEPGYFMLGLANLSHPRLTESLPSTLSALATPPQIHRQAPQPQVPQVPQPQPQAPQPPLPPRPQEQPNPLSDADINNAIEKSQSIVQTLQALAAERKESRDKIAELKEEINQAKNAKPSGDVLQRITIDDVDIDRLDSIQLHRVKEQLNKLLLKVQDNIDNNDKCVVCLDLRKSVAFLPCKHVCCCVECSELKTCPLCRGEISDKIILFT